MRVFVLAVVCVLGVSACDSDDGEAAAPDGGEVYAENCSSCHGERAEGLFKFPRLAGVVATKYPNPADQVAVVTNGRGEMPAFGGRLSPEEIRAVVEFTRALR